MSTKRKQISKEFKEQTVQLVLAGEKTQAQLAREIGININTIQNWKKAYLAEQDPQQLEKLSYEEENKKFKKQLREAQLENEILKKAVCYFSRETL